MDLDYDDCKPKPMFYSQVDCNPMDVLYQRRCAKYIYVVPEGLRELMSDITREVLRCQPKEIYCFVADYLDALLVTRENAKVAALFVENVTEAGVTLRDILFKTSLSLEQAVRACRIIQRAFRRHLNMKKGAVTTPLDPYMIICKMMVRLKITYEQASEAARVIQTAWRTYKMRMEIWRERFQTTVDWRTACRYTLRLYKQYAATWEYTRAATIIQAAYRGYYTRRLLRLYCRMRPTASREELLEYLTQQYVETGEEYIEENPEIVKQIKALKALKSDGNVSLETLYILYDPEDKAARIIQRTFKRLMKRKSTRGVLQPALSEAPTEVETEPASETAATSVEMVEEEATVQEATEAEDQ